jgi:hypothetical protein
MFLYLFPPGTDYPSYNPGAKIKVMLRLKVSQSVSQYVLVSRNLCPDIILCLKVAVLSLWGALSDERSDLSPVSQCHQCLVHCQRFNIIYIVHVTCFKYMQYILDLVVKALCYKLEGRGFDTR